MIDIADTPEEALDSNWLCVWRNLVEEYWNYIRKPDEDNDPYYTSGRALSKPHYTFASMRRDKCRPEESIDEDVSKLAQNFWERNRSDLKEYFINCTCDNWPDKDKYEVQRAVDGVDWLDCGVDPAYPDRKYERNTHDAPYLSDIGVFQSLLHKAMSKAKWDKFKTDLKKLDEKRKTSRKEKIDRMKKFVSDVFHKLF